MTKAKNQFRGRHRWGSLIQFNSETAYHRAHRRILILPYDVSHPVTVTFLSLVLFRFVFRQGFSVQACCPGITSQLSVSSAGSKGMTAIPWLVTSLRQVSYSVCSSLLWLHWLAGNSRFHCLPTHPHPTTSRSMVTVSAHTAFTVLGI